MKSLLGREKGFVPFPLSTCNHVRAVRKKKDIFISLTSSPLWKLYRTGKPVPEVQMSQW